MTNEEKILDNTEEILRILKEEFDIDDEPTPVDPSDDETTSFEDELREKMQTSTIPEIVEWFKETLNNLELYSEDDMIIKIITDSVGDIVLEFKIKPYNRWGKVIDWFYTNMGDPDYFETSRYNMRVIMVYKLTKYTQIEPQEEDTGIVDDVNEDWNELNGNQNT